MSSYYQPLATMSLREKIPISNVCLGVIFVICFRSTRLFGAAPLEKSSNFFQKTLILAFEENSELSCQNGLFSTLFLIVCYVFLCMYLLRITWVEII